MFVLCGAGQTVAHMILVLFSMPVRITCLLVSSAVVASVSGCAHARLLSAIWLLGRCVCCDCTQRLRGALGHSTSQHFRQQ
eukprot:7850427-Alexandrium_andersonii.AAC.1